ncbi:MAG TPA: O-methyltransferase [bacterium]|nr:O-methyltransferase [bacterium]
MYYDNEILRGMEEQSATRADTRSFIEPEVARLINTFILTLDAKNVLELGTCIGYSGIWMSEALKRTNGFLTTIDYDIALLDEARINFKKAGVSERIKILEGDITEVTKKLPTGYFDIVFQDARKSLYPVMLEECIRLVRTGGIIIADDTLYSRKGTAEKISLHLREYNKMVLSDKRLYSSIVSIGQGLTISTKL